MVGLGLRERLARTEGASSGLASRVRAVAATASQAATLRTMVETLVGFDGCIPIELGLKALSRFQRAVLRLPRADAPMSPARPAARETAASAHALVVGLRAGGRIMLELEPSIGPGDIITGKLWLDAAELATVAGVIAEDESRDATREREMTDYLAGLTDDAARHMVEQLARAIDCFDPISVYVEEHAFSSTPVHGNLIKPRGGSGGEDTVLVACARRPVEQWQPAERALIYSLHWLRAAGFTGEEFNGVQLGPGSLDAFFDRYISSWTRAIGRAGDGPPRAAPLAEKAAFLQALRLELQDEHTLYRWINGISLYKEQRFYRKREVSPFTVDELPPPIADVIGSTGAVLRPGAPLDDLLRSFVERALEAAPCAEPPSLHPVEALIVVIVRTATEDLQSEIGMSRGLRELGQLARVHDHDLVEEAGDWPQSEYFCAVVPGAQIATELRRDALADVLKAISVRMRFNSWHYMPGHFPVARKRPDRHMYVPPRMADLTEWGDQHHRGHVAAGVRYAMRLPGALRYRDKTFPGLYDLRVMRREGPPYTLAELQRASRYCLLLGSLYQGLFDAVHTHPGFRIAAFTNAWFYTVAWDELFAAPDLANLAAGVLA